MKRHAIITTLLFLLLAAAGTVKAQQLVDGWKKIYTGAEGNLYDICCLDADNIWVCAQDGGLLKSSDGGETWIRKHTEEGFAMSRIKFANTDVGYAMGVRNQSDMVLLRTDDAGETWTRVADTALDAVAIGRDEWRYGDWQLIGTDTLYVFESRPYSTGWATLYRSTDGGHSFDNFYWELPYEPSTEHQSAKAIGLFFEYNEGYCVFWSGHDVWHPHNLGVFRTTDYGQTWTRYSFFVGSTNYYSLSMFRTARIHIINKLEARLFFQWGYFDTNDGFVSANLTENIESYSYPIGSNGPFDLTFSDDNHGCVIGLDEGSFHDWLPDGYHARITNDGGETWNLLTNGMDTDRHLFAVDGVDTTFYVTSENGVVYKRSLIELAAVDEEPLTTLTVSPTLTEGEVTLSGVKLREVTVYNTLGQFVLTKKEDADTMTLDLTGQPSGCYFISVTDQNGQRCVKKIVKQ